MHRFGHSIISDQVVAHRGWATLAMAAVLLLLPSSAYAHGLIPGIGDWVNGLVHPLRVPIHILMIVSLGLWLGQHKPLRFTPTMVAFVVCSAVGLLIVILTAFAGVSPPLMLVLVMGLALLVVIERSLPVTARVVVCALAGFALGLDSAPDAASTLSQVKLSLGTWISLPVLVFDLAFYASLAQRPWMHIGRRVLGSWTLAVAILMLAFYWKS